MRAIVFAVATMAAILGTAVLGSSGAGAQSAPQRPWSVPVWAMPTPVNGQITDFAQSHPYPHFALPSVVIPRPVQPNFAFPTAVNGPFGGHTPTFVISTATNTPVWTVTQHPTHGSIPVPNGGVFVPAFAMPTPVNGQVTDAISQASLPTWTFTEDPGGGGYPFPPTWPLFAAPTPINGQVTDAISQAFAPTWTFTEDPGGGGYPFPPTWPLFAAPPAYHPAYHPAYQSVAWGAPLAWWCGH